MSEKKIVLVLSVAILLPLLLSSFLLADTNDEEYLKILKEEKARKNERIVSQIGVFGTTDDKYLDFLKKRLEGT